MPTENHLPAALFNVSPMGIQLQDPAGIPSPNIIHFGDPIVVQVDWTQTGLLPRFGYINPGNHYDVRVFVEKMGPGDGPSIPAPPITPVRQGNLSENYIQNVTLNGLRPGVYKCVVTLSFWDANHRWSVFHAFNEGTMFEVIAA